MWLDNHKYSVPLCIPSTTTGTIHSYCNIINYVPYPVLCIFIFTQDTPVQTYL